MLGQGATGNPNMPQMVGHNSGTSVEMGGNYLSNNSLMQGNISDISNMNPNMVVHINSLPGNMGGFNPSMSAGMTNLGQGQ